MAANKTYDIEYSPSKYHDYLNWGKDIFASDEVIYKLSDEIVERIAAGERVRLVVRNDIDQAFANKQMTSLAEADIHVEVFRPPAHGGVAEEKTSAGGRGRRPRRPRRTRRTRRRKTASRKRSGRKHKKTRARARRG
jgi:hypothetical protein